MKATGIVRRIDDLGRVVIPKEIRRTMRIREGDPLEIYTDKEGGVIFRKYSALGGISSFAADCAAALYTTSGIYCAVCDTDSVIAFSGQGKRDIIERTISSECDGIIDSRKCFSAGKDAVPLTDGSGAPEIMAACPIIAQGDALGLIAFLQTPGKSVGEGESMLLSATALFLGKQMEN